VLENWKGDAEDRMNKHDEAHSPDPVHTEPSAIRAEDSERCTVRVEQCAGSNSLVQDAVS